MSKSRETFEEWFKRFNTWNLTGEDFLQFSFVGENPGDEAYISPEGSVLTNHMANSLRHDYKAYKIGWNACLRSMEEDKDV